MPHFFSIFNPVREREAIDFDAWRKNIFIGVLVIMVLPALLIFGAYDIAAGRLVEAGIIFFISGVLVAILVYLRREHPPGMLYRVAAISFLGLLLIYLRSGGEGGGQALWMYLFPPVSFFLLERRGALAANLLLAACCAYVFFARPAWAYGYPAGFAVRFFVSYAILFFISLIVDTILAFFQRRFLEEERQLKADNRFIRETAAKDLRQSEDRFAALAEKVGKEYFFYRQDANGSFVRISPSMTDILGYSEEEFATRYAEFMAGSSMRQQARRNAERNAPDISHPSFEVETHDKFGSVRHLQIKEIPVFGDGSHVIAVEGIAHDITERRRTRELLVQTERILSLGGLASGIAHEINNPLTSILLNAETTRNRLKAGGMKRNAARAEACGTDFGAIRCYMEAAEILPKVEAIIDAARYTARTLDNMLSFSRPSRKGFMPHSLAALVEETLTVLASDFSINNNYDFKKIPIERAYGKGVDDVICCGDQIRQVLLNIFKNGAQAMASATAEHSSEGNGERPEPCFTVRMARDDGMACVAIEDNGPGMTAETCRRIFDPFFTTRGPVGGTGLGLSVSYYIICEHHHGQLEVHSSPGKGACFTIRLPVTPPGSGSTR